MIEAPVRVAILTEGPVVESLESIEQIHIKLQVIEHVKDCFLCCWTCARFRVVSKRV